MNIQALIYDTTVGYDDISLSGGRTKNGNSEPDLSLRQHRGSASGVDQDYLQSSVSMLFCVHVYEQIYDDVYGISFQFMGHVILSFGFSVSPRVVFSDIQGQYIDRTHAIITNCSRSILRRM